VRENRNFNLMKIEQLSESQASMILNALPKVGPVTLRRLLSAFDNDPLKIFTASKRELMRVDGLGQTVADAITGWIEKFDLQKEEEKLAAIEGEFLDLNSTDYPHCLGKFMTLL